MLENEIYLNLEEKIDCILEIADLNNIDVSNVFNVGEDNKKALLLKKLFIRIKQLDHSVNKLNNLFNKILLDSIYNIILEIINTCYLNKVLLTKEEKNKISLNICNELMYKIFYRLDMNIIKANKYLLKKSDILSQI